MVDNEPAAAPRDRDAAAMRSAVEALAPALARELALERVNVVTSGFH